MFPALEVLQDALLLSDRSWSSEDPLSQWLDAMTAAGLAEAGRHTLVQALTVDGPRWSAHPASLASGLLARIRDVPALAAAYAQWRKALIASGLPWVEALRPLPLQSALRAALYEAPAKLDQVEFLDEETLLFQSQQGQLRWRWRSHRTERLKRMAPQESKPSYPSFERRSWEPPRMQRGPGEALVALPCPEESSAEAKLSKAPGVVLVFGCLDEYAGGFVWRVDLHTLEVKETLSTRESVWSLHESADGKTLLANTSEGLVLWRGGAQQSLHTTAHVCALSPSGVYVATRRDAMVQIWALDEMPRGIPPDRLPTRFSPNGTRLVCGNALYDGRDGRRIATLDFRLGHYLEGGPPRPWMHMGDEQLICLHGGLRVWRSEDGAPMKTGSGRLPFVRRVAYNASGTRMATRSMEGPIELLSVPEMDPVAQLRFERKGPIAISPSGQRVAVMEDGVVEVRNLEGAVRTEEPDPSWGPCSLEGPEQSWLCFVDEETLLGRVDDKGWRLYRPEGGTSPKSPRASGWTLEAQGGTVFTEPQTGAQIWLPLTGPWIMNPKDPMIMACSGGLVRLHPTRDASDQLLQR